MICLRKGSLGPGSGGAAFNSKYKAGKNHFLTDFSSPTSPSTGTGIFQWVIMSTGCRVSARGDPPGKSWKFLGILARKVAQPPPPVFPRLQCFAVPKGCFTICLFISPDLDGHRAPKMKYCPRRDRSMPPFLRAVSFEWPISLYPHATYRSSHPSTHLLVCPRGGFAAEMEQEQGQGCLENLIEGAMKTSLWGKRNTFTCVPTAKRQQDVKWV